MKISAYLCHRLQNIAVCSACGGLTHKTDGRQVLQAIVGVSR